jgi:hypothetical protein
MQSFAAGNSARDDRRLFKNSPHCLRGPQKDFILKNDLPIARIIPLE